MPFPVYLIERVFDDGSRATVVLRAGSDGEVARFGMGWVTSAEHETWWDRFWMGRFHVGVHLFLFVPLINLLFAGAIVWFGLPNIGWSCRHPDPDDDDRNCTTSRDPSEVPEFAHGFCELVSAAFQDAIRRNVQSEIE